MSHNQKRFGYQWLIEFNAKKLFKQNINVYVNFYFHNVHTHELVETPLFILSKQDLDNPKLDKNEVYKNALSEIKMKNVFPNSIMETFFYTDNRTVIPKEFLTFEEIQDLEVNQLSFNFN